VDALRAPHVVVSGVQAVPVCSGHCRERFAAGERMRPSEMLAPRGEAPAAPTRALPRITKLALPASPIVLTGGALLLSAFATQKGVALATALVLVVASVDLSIRSFRLRAPRAALPLASLGVALIAIGSYRAFESSGAMALTVASLAGLSVAARFVLWFTKQEPLDRDADALVAALGQTLDPARVEAHVTAFGGGSRDGAAVYVRAAVISERVGLLLATAAAALVFFLPLRVGNTATVMGAVLVSLPLLAPRAATARAQLYVALRAAARGIFFGGPRALEQLGQVAHVIFPAHGTLTLPRAELVGIRLLTDESASEAWLLALVTAAEAAAGAHPVAVACRDACRARDIDVPLARRTRAVEGRGVLALASSGEDVVVGHRALLLSEGVSVARADKIANEIEASGDTAVFVAVSGRVRGVLAFRYIIREGTAETIERLQSLDVDTTLLSGDHHSTAESLARRLGIPHVRAELLPSEKLTELTRIQENPEPVVLIEHADASTSLLPAARLSVRLGGAAAPGGHGAAILGDDPRLAGEAIALARRLRRSMFASGVVIAVCGIPTLTLAALFDLSPAIAALVPLFVEAFAHPTGARAT
jgi:soluble P-type ATPase